MDSTNFYHLGQIRHQEMVQEAENRRRAESLRAEPTVWQRLIAQFVRLPAKQAEKQVARPDILTSTR
jgi:hypothetical protein